ncbi:MAG: FitA-like ribbon-helix-helix domain-containing protein [Terrimicrobiaceae bacterium]
MASILLQNIPPHIHEKLQARAGANHTSIESETLNCLEAALRPAQDLRVVRISNDSLWESRHSSGNTSA